MPRVFIRIRREEDAACIHRRDADAATELRHLNIHSCMTNPIFVSFDFIGSPPLPILRNLCVSIFVPQK